MPRQYTNVPTSLGSEPDWRALSFKGQWLYHTLWFSPKIDLAGVIDWRPAKIATRAAGMTPKMVESFAGELVKAGFIVVDEDTEEVLIRAFIRRDGVLKGPKQSAGLANAIADIGSERIRRAVYAAVLSEARRDPGLKGLACLGDVLAVAERYEADTPSDTPSARYPAASDTPSGWHADGYPDGMPGGSLPRLGDSISLIPCSAPDEDPPEDPDRGDRFDDFYAAYPKKVDKGHARKAWVKAVKDTDPDVIIDGLKAQGPYAGASERRFIPNPATWLNGQRWEDEPPAGVPGKPDVDPWDSVPTLRITG